MEKHQEPPGKESVPWKATVALSGASAAGCVFGMIVGLVWSLVQPSRSSDALAALKNPPQGQVAADKTESFAKHKDEQEAQKKSKPKTTDEVTQAWETAGARVGKIQVGKTGKFGFRPEQTKKNEGWTVLPPSDLALK